ncbi:hypothetical protein HDV02_001389 [Globomyces sp. JEL0801]|nr:hypothetical protein HDV02_001389 [Globomyces sp. JEL0801]
MRPASFILNHTLQATVARRGLLVFVVYMVGYAFPLGGSVYKSLTKKTLPLWIENVIVSLVTGHACVNPLVYYIAEPRLRRSKPNRQLRNNQVAPANQQTDFMTNADKEPLVHPFNKKVRQLRIGLILFSSVVVAAIPMICDIHFTIQDNQGNCFHDFHSSSVNRSLSIISTGIAFELPIVVVVYVYYSIWKRLHDTIHAASFILNYTLQITVARRGLLVIMVYLVGYAFPLGGSVYKSLTKKTLPLWMENLIASLVTGHACVNPLVYYIAEPRLRRNISNRQLRNNQVAPANRQINTTTTDDKEPLVHPFNKKVRQVRTIHDISDDLSNNL